MKEKKEGSLDYVIKIIYKDGSCKTEGTRAISPELLIVALDDGDGIVPKFENYDQLLSLIYNKLDEYKLNKKEVEKLQIYNEKTKTIIFTKYNRKGECDD